MTAMKTWDFGKTADYERGPWSGEPDKAQWVDEATGLDCLIVRNHMGALCGYVGVPPIHPLHGVGYSQCTNKDCAEEWCYDHTPGGLVDVHGGLTYADACQEREDGQGICHVPEPGRPADVWWFGFDCAHSGDDVPGMRQYGAFGGAYRDIGYVQAECASLAAQLAAVTR